MTRNLFFEWLIEFESYIGWTPGRRVALLIDNASCHGRIENLPSLRNVEVLFLPKRTTFLVQPLDAGIIACIKRRYRRRQLTRAVDLIEIEASKNVYSVDLYEAITAI